MNVIVVGCGRVGSQLATLLSVEGHNVTVIDKDDDAFRRLGDTFNGETIKGLGFDEEILTGAGAATCDVFAAVTNLDNTNLMAAEVARKIFNIKRVVARLYNPLRERTYEQLGLEYVCGTSLVAASLHERIESGHSHYVDAFGDVEIRYFSIADNLVGRTVASIAVEGKILPAIIRRGGQTFIPTGATVFEQGDVLRVAVKSTYATKLDKYMKAEG